MGSVAVTRLKRATSSLKSARSRPWPDASSEPQGPELLPLIIRRWRTLGARPRRCGRQASIRDRSAYGKPNRTTSADRDGLALYTSALMEFLKETPTSFPCQQGVRQALLILAEIYQILGCEPRFAIKVASGAADLWRVVLKDLHDLRRKDIFVPPLKELLDLIEFPSSCGFEFGDGVHDTDDGPLRIPAMATISAHPALATCEAGDAAMADATLGDVAGVGRPPVLDDAIVEVLFAAACPRGISGESSAETIDTSNDEPTLVSQFCRCPDCERLRNVRIPSALKRGPSPRDGAKGKEKTAGLEAVPEFEDLACTKE